MNPWKDWKAKLEMAHFLKVQSKAIDVYKWYWVAALLTGNLPKFFILWKKYYLGLASFRRHHHDVGGLGQCRRLPKSALKPNGSCLGSLGNLGSLHADLDNHCKTFFACTAKNKDIKFKSISNVMFQNVLGCFKMLWRYISLIEEFPVLPSAA